MSQRGLSLVETVIALFILAGASFATLALLAEAGNNQRLTLETLAASRFAQQGLERVSIWAKTPGNFNSWAVYADSTFQDPAYPGYDLRIQANLTSRPLVTPNSSLEQPFFPDVRKVDQRCHAVKATVSWISRRPHSYSLQTLVGASTAEVRALSPLVISLVSGAASPMSFNDIGVYKAELMDSSNQAIPGVLFRWAVKPNYTLNDPGMASLEPIDRSGLQAALIHHFYAGDPATPEVAGQINLRVFCRYGGKEWETDSATIQLLP